MSATLLTAATALVGLVPTLNKWFKDPEIKSNTQDFIASKVIDIAKAITGAENPLDAVSVLQKDPQLLLEFQRTVLHLNHDLERAHYEDKRDARARDVALMTSGKRNRRADIMVISAAVGLMSCLACLIMLQGHLPGEAIGIMSTIAGIFGACLKDAYAFEFGSSRGSHLKDMAALVKGM